MGEFTSRRTFGRSSFARGPASPAPPSTRPAVAAPYVPLLPLADAGALLKDFLVRMTPVLSPPQRAQLSKAVKVHGSGAVMGAAIQVATAEDMLDTVLAAIAEGRMLDALT